ncbi:MAG TPA: GNAT family N-acetyltransferase, partial [Solirubrobacteraceae bacterium]
MRIAVVGLGSIGRRHAEIALALGHELTVYDPDPGAASPPDALRATSVNECLRAANAAIVASPSSMHVAHARIAIELGVPVLVEKPLALDARSAAELDWLARERGTLLSVAMNLREHPGVQALSGLMTEGAAGEVLRASAWCGSWLPGWRPGGDYRNSYSARRELGGGALLDVAVHELDYLLQLIGPARSVSALARHVSELEADVEDVALIAMELERGGLAEVTVDYFDRAYTRGCRIVGSKATLHWSWEKQVLTQHDASGRTHESTLSSDVAPTYRAQLQRFLQAVGEGGPAPVPAASAQRVLAVIDAARLSSREGRRVALPPTVTLRAARAEDAELLLAWRNDPQTRHWSRSAREIGAEEHASWLGQMLADSSTRLWVAEVSGGPIGHVRVGPRTEDETAEVHIALTPEARSRGLGTAILVQVAARALADPLLGTLCAYVKPGNEASLRAFARAGFH